MTGTDIIVSAAIAVGLVGILLPVLPGGLLVGVAIVGWGFERQTTTGWVVVAVAVALLLVGTVVKYAVPGRRLRRDGTPTSTLLAGGVLGVVGFFVLPVIGLPIGFLLGIYLAELRRLRAHDQAWPATKRAMKAVGLSVLIELTAALLASAVWVVGVVLV
ncbi:MAG: hypothetical protein JWO46_2397 [Nocardioidaceae bacterium]|nr:hypothetical protein [Nocardioidaceae bacterium]